MRVLTVCATAEGGVHRVVAWLEQTRGPNGGAGVPDLIEAHGWRAGWRARAKARSWGVPLVVVAHGYPPRGRAQQAAWRFLERTLRPTPRAYVAVSRPLARWLRRRVRAPVWTVPLVPPVTSVSRAEARRMLGLAPGARVVGTVGRLVHEKGFDLLLDAWARLQRRPDAAGWLLCIVGDGPLAGSLRRRARLLGVEDTVLWAGRLPGAGALMPAFDLYVQPSRSEGLGLAALEAAAAGVPALVSDAGGLADVAALAPASVAAGDLEDLTRRLEAMLGSDAAHLQAAGARFRDAVRRRFPPGRSLQALEALYGSFCLPGLAQ